MRIFTMRRIVAVSILTVLVACGSLFAQAQVQRNPSEYHFFTVHIERIYAHRLGFVVVYRSGPHGMARSFIPADWFQEAGGRAEMIPMRAGTAWPSMTVFHHQGEFSHVRLRVRRDRNHVTWGVVPFTANIDEYFQGIEEVRLEF